MSYRRYPEKLVFPEPTLSSESMKDGHEPGSLQQQDLSYSSSCPEPKAKMSTGPGFRWFLAFSILDHSSFCLHLRFFCLHLNSLPLLLKEITTLSLELTLDPRGSHF